MRMHQHTFAAMGTQVGLWLWSGSPAAPLALELARQRFRDYERELSRFRPDSSLSRLNRKAGQGPQPVSSTLLEVVVLSLACARASHGLFDPTVLYALCQAGYRSPGVVGPGARPDWGRVQVDQEASTIGLPAGMGLDLGGIGKGWSADRVAEMLAVLGPTLVDAGGDIRALGLPWPVAVQDPFRLDQDLDLLVLQDRAVATSSVGKRGPHLIDPRTGEPSTSDVHTAVVLAPTAVEAEVAAKVALLLGRRRGARYLTERGLEFRLILKEAS